MTTRVTTRWGVAALAGAAVVLSFASGPAGTTPLPADEMSPLETAQPVAWTGGLGGAAPCPEGRTRSATLMTEGFGSGIPNNSFNNGWATVAGSVDGRAARSVVSSSDSEDWFFTDWGTGSPGTQTMLAFASRGNVSSSSYSRADVNSVSLHAAANTSSWRGKVFDVTAATDDEGGRLGTWFQHRSQAGASQWWEVDNVQLYTCRAAAVSRIQGADRFATSAAIAATYPVGPDVVYLANGRGFADALAGSALAAKADAPVLLVEQDRIPTSVAAELDRLEPANIVVFGGPSSVSDTVLTQAGSYTAGEVTRLAGANRYATSAAIAETYPAGISTVYIASGTGYADALSGGASAGRNARPMLLTDPTSLPPETRAALTALEPGSVVILGGPSSVSDTVAAQLAAYTTGGVSRIAGADRYDTSARIARTFPLDRDRVFVATGTSFPDALSGSALAGKEATPVVLTRPSNLPSEARSAIDRLTPGSGVVLGGDGSVHSIVLDQLGQHVG